MIFQEGKIDSLSGDGMSIWLSYSLSNSIHSTKDIIWGIGVLLGKFHLKIKGETLR